METDGISEIALPVGTVLRIVQDALNGQWLKVPHQVVDMDYDRANETVHFDLVLKAAPAAEVGYLVEEVALVESSTRANGHGAPLPRRLVVAQHVGEGSAARKPTDEDKAAIRDMVRADRTRTAASMAEELGLPVKSVAYFVTVYRKELAQAAGDAGHGDGNNRLASLTARPSHQPRPARRVRKRLQPDHARQALTHQPARLARPRDLPCPGETAPAPARPSAPPPACC